MIIPPIIIIFSRICVACNQNIPNHWVIGLDNFWHQDCFCCGICGRVVDAKETFYEKDGEFPSTIVFYRVPSEL